MTVVSGYSSSQEDHRLQQNQAQVVPVGPWLHALVGFMRSTVRLIETDAVEAGTTTSIVKATAHNAQAGDIIRFTSGTFSGREVSVDAIASDWIYLAETLSAAPAALDTFKIYRFTSPLVNSEGRLQVDIVSGGGGGGGGTGFVFDTTTITADYTAAGFSVILADTTTGNITVTLPSPATELAYFIKKLDSTGNDVIIDGAGATIDGSLSITLENQYDTLGVVCDGSDWHII